MPSRRENSGCAPRLRSRPEVTAAIERCGAQLHYLPAYSPDFNPIELAFAKLKAHLHRANSTKH